MNSLTFVYIRYGTTPRHIERHTKHQPSYSR